jgi:hypothetical protein
MVLLQGARRENILYGSSTGEQRRSRAKDRATLRAEFWRVAGGVAPQSQSATAMLFRRASPAARQNSAHQSLFMKWVLEKRNLGVNIDNRFAVDVRKHPENDEQAKHKRRN